MVYTVASVVAGLILPRLEQVYFPAYSHSMSAAAAMALFSAISSGMMALTGIVFAIAFVMVQFSALAYSPRLVILFVSSPTLHHSLGIFFATFVYALVALMWTDRGGSGTVPLFSTLLVLSLLIASLLAFVRLIGTVNDLQIHNVLQSIGSRGRTVIRAMFPRIADEADAIGLSDAEVSGDLGPVTQTLTYSGEPRVIARIDIDTLVRLAQSANSVVSIECGVGETVVEDTVPGERAWRRTEFAGTGTDACHSSRDIAYLRAGPEICHTSAGGHRHQGTLSRNQRSDDGSAGNRPDRGFVATSWSQAIGCRLCPRRDRYDPRDLSRPDLG